MFVNIALFISIFVVDLGEAMFMNITLPITCICVPRLASRFTEYDMMFQNVLVEELTGI